MDNRQHPNHPGRGIGIRDELNRASHVLTGTRFWSQESNHIGRDIDPQKDQNELDQPMAMSQEEEDPLPVPVTPNPMTQANAETRARASPYPLKTFAMFGSSAVITVHSVFGVRMMFFAL